MKLVRFGAPGAERPGIVDAQGAVRDLSAHVTDITGETLGKRLARTGLTMGESVRMVTRVAETLAVAHAKGIIHRDIKPGNLILRDGNVENPT